MRYYNLKNKIFVHFLLFTFFTGCISKTEEIKSDKLLDFDINPDGRSMIFSLVNSEGRPTIYRANIDGTKPVEICRSTDGLSSYLPRYSHNGDKIVLIRRKSDLKKTSVWIADQNGLKQITDSSGLIVEAVFSYDDKNLYFTRANDYVSSSLSVGGAAHGFDIYLFNLSEKKYVKLSNLNAYGLYHITDLNNNDMLINMYGKEDGIFLYTKTKKKIKRLVSSNDTINNSSGYSTPVVISPNNIICSSYYDLVNLDTRYNTEKQILKSTGTHFKILRFNKRLGKIFFKKKDDLNSIFSINIDGSDLKEIPIVVN